MSEIKFIIIIIILLQIVSAKANPLFGSLNYSDIFNNSDEKSTPKVIQKKREDYPHKWIIMEFDSKKLTNKGLERFIENSKLTDSKVIQLFKQANYNFDKYEELKEQWIYKYFNSSLKQLTYYKMLEKFSAREKNRRFFKISSSKLFNRIEKFENNLLKRFLDEGHGIRYAREKFADFLKQQKYPHKQSDTLLEVYHRWKRIQDARIKEELRIEQVNELEYIIANPKARPNYFISPGDIYNLNEKAVRKVNQIFSRQNLTSSEIDRLISENPIVSTILKGIQRLSYDESKLSDLQEYAPEKFNRLKQTLPRYLSSFVTENASLKYMKYKKMALEIARSKTNQEIQESLNNILSKIRRSEQGNYSHIALAKIYNIASFFKSQRITSIRQSVDREINNALKSLQTQINSDAFYADVSNPLEIHVEKFLQDNLSYDSQVNNLNNVLKDFFIFLTRIEIKKFTSKDRPIYRPVVREYSKFEAQPFLKAHFIESKFQENLKKFKQRDLRRKFKWSISINPTGEYKIRNNRAIDYIFD